MDVRSVTAQARSQQRGFTLVEMLVSMVILGFVMSLVSQAVFQVAQVTRAADATTRNLARHWGAGWSAGSLFANLLAPQLRDEEPVFRGGPERAAGFTSQPLDASDTGIVPFELVLRPDPVAAVTHMLLAPSAAMTQADTSKPADDAIVATFNGRAEFAFVDRNGQTLLTWPPLTRTGFEAEDLPKAVVVRDARTQSLLMWYGFFGETQRQRPPTSPFGTLPGSQ